MFKLLFNKRKYSRGIKILAERTYVAIGLCGFKLVGEETYTTHITIDLYNDEGTYTLIIPDDKVESVAERLLEAKRKKEHNAKVAAER